ncbi:MAG: hypothetical protein EPO40_13350 [Myxococcaceae bacterium]|nr:MAG: hypothetical protein EPO40_13350 [Myxococcaceae bacterium]
MEVIGAGQDELIRHMVAPSLPEGWDFEGARVDVAAITARYVHRADRAVAVMTLTHSASGASKMATTRFTVDWRVSASARDPGALVRSVMASVRTAETGFVWSRRAPAADPTVRRESEDAIAAEQALAMVEATPVEDLRLSAISGDEFGTVEVELPREDGARLSVRLQPRRGRVVARLAREGDEGAEHNWPEVEHPVRWFATLGRLFPHLRLGLSEAREAAEGQRDAIVLDPPGVAELLSPEVTLDGAPIAGHRLVAVRSFLPTGSAASPFGRVLLEFAPEHSRETVELLLAPTSPQQSCFGSHAGLGLSLPDLGLAATAGAKTRAARLGSHLLALLASKLAPHARVVVPTRAEEVRLLGAEAASPNPEVLNLNLDAECGQQCTFCPIKSFVPAHDGGAAELQSIELQLREARARAQVRARLNGIDPLRFSRVLELASAIRAAGFERLEVMGPGRRFADEAFRREFLRRAPEHTEVVVPLYGVTPEVHDLVTGAPGSHAEVLRAIDGLRADLDPQRLGLATVITRQNVDELAALARFARERELPLWPQLPYPLRQTRHGAYADSALRESEIVARVLRSLDGATPEDRAFCLQALATAIRHPCVLWRAQRATGLGVFEASRGMPRRALAGVALTDEHNPRKGGAARGLSTLHVVSAACAEAPRCALAPACPAEHYAAYVERFGEEEFEAVGVWDLV